MLLTARLKPDALGLISLQIRAEASPTLLDGPRSPTIAG
jgi:hypothetical protein